MYPNLSNFNIRTYCLFHSKQNNSVLISSEEYRDFQLVKFPGGGLEFNEGPIACIKRELKEEFDLDVSTQLLRPFYFSQACFPSFLMNGDQVVLLYYYYDFDQNPIDEFKQLGEYDGNSEFKLGLSWLSLKELYQEEFTSSADQECFQFLFNELL